MNKISRVSFSRLMDFEKCKKLAKLKYIDKIPEPERPLPKGKTEHANDRGTRIHDAAEQYVKGGVELVPELHNFKDRFEELREEYAKGNVQLEGEWAVNLEWEPVAWNSSDAWCRMKLDAIQFTNEDKTEAIVIDYKTGKRYGNEIKHTEQGLVYQLAAFLRFPELQHIQVQFWYTDLNETDIKNYSRAQGVAYFNKYHNRFYAVTSCEDFPANPNTFSCRWCPYNQNECKEGVVATKPKKTAKQKFNKTKKMSYL